MYGGGTPWPYINAKNQLNATETELRSVERNVSGFKIAYSHWLTEGEKLVELMKRELQKNNPELNKIKDIADRLAAYLQRGAGLTKKLN